MPGKNKGEVFNEDSYEMQIVVLGNTSWETEIFSFSFFSPLFFTSQLPSCLECANRMDCTYSIELNDALKKFRSKFWS